MAQLTFWLETAVWRDLWLLPTGARILDDFGNLLSLPCCLGSDKAASEAAPAALDLTSVPSECAVLAMTITMLGALFYAGPDLPRTGWLLRHPVITWMVAVPQLDCPPSIKE